jgi:cytochrome c oxidase cbb3-type subunit 3
MSLSMLSTTKCSYSVVLPLLAVWAVNVLVAKSQVAPQNLRQRPLKSGSVKSDLDSGKETFASTCAGCHGLDGKGGERAPNIAERPKVQRLSDIQIARIVENGIPGTGMPAFHSLENSQVTAVVGYLRTLQGINKAVKMPGDPNNGKTIFFGQAGCSGCHMVAGEGGFIASDLSAYARMHAVEQIRNAIVRPAAGSSGSVRLATATIRGGQKYVGRVRNEDNFSLQLQALNGTFHFLSKSEIESLEYDSQMLMPSDFGSSLSPAALNDLISYLISAAGASTPVTPAKADELEQ